MSNKKQILVKSSTSETGHAKDVANFESLITSVAAYNILSIISLYNI